MKKHSLIALAIAGLFALNGTAWADKPSDKPGKAGSEKHGKKNERSKKNEHAERYQDDRSGDRHTEINFHFNDDSRRVIGDYYGAQIRAGNCPPGLAKKQNGCLPPGQAKKWAMGRPLPADLHYYDLPHDLIVRLPPPPPRHRYVQVAGDILMIAVGTSMVVDAIEDITR